MNSINSINSIISNVTHLGDINQRYRKNMEDFYLSVPSLDISCPNSALFAVFDGHAGSIASEKSSKVFENVFTSVYREETLKSSDNIMDYPKNDNSVLSILRHSFVALDAILSRGQSSKELDYQGCTIACAFISRSPKDMSKFTLYIANCGDTRIVLSRGGVAIRLTMDHKPTFKSEKERIIKSGGSVMGGRVNRAIGVSRALGDFALKEYISSTPFTNVIPIDSTDEFIIIATDGLWDVIKDQKVVDFVRQKKELNLKPIDIAKELINKAKENGSTDNICVLIVFFS